MINSGEINNFIKNNSKITKKNGLKKNQKELISPLNYTWKELFKLMNKIKLIWHMRKFDNIFMLDTQALNKYIYNNLKFCNKTPNLRVKNNILESDINSFFQTNLFGYLSEEQEIFDYYDNLFNKKQYIPKKDENEEIPFGDFITDYRDIFYAIQKNKKNMRQLKKIRWYIIMDEDNFYEDKKNNNNFFNINNNDFLMDFSKEVENNNDSFDEEETNIYYKEYLKNEKEKVLDNLEEIFEKNIINDKIIDKLLNNEKYKIFYIVKLIYLSISIFCKATICHLLNNFSDIEECKYEEGKYLTNRYLLCFNNFVDSCILINKKCININIAINYLYKELFENYPDFPKFSIFRMCIRIWFTEANTHLFGQNSLLSKIKDKLASIFSNNLKEELFNKMEDNLKNKNSFNSKSVIYDKSKSFNLSTSFMLFNSDNLNNKMNDYFSPYCFGSKYINTYNDSDKQYKILDKGLSIINDTFSNEYSVYLLNLSSIDTNTLYDELVNNFKNSIAYYINEIFNIYSNDKNYDIKDVIDNILNYFDNYFFKTRIIPNLKKTIYEKVYLEIKNNLLEYIKNKYLDKNFSKTKKFNISHNNNNSNNSSTKTNFSSSLNSKSVLKSSIINLNFGNNYFNENDEFNNDTYKKEIIDYIIKNTWNNNKSNNEIETKIEEINKQTNIYDLFNYIEKWNEDHINTINKNDKKVMEELININIKLNINISIPLKFNYLKRYLLSYSLQYDWAFIKKVKNIENYLNRIKTNENEDIEMDLNNNNELGLNYFTNDDNIENNNNELDVNYFNNLNNIGNINNNVGFNLRSSFFDY